MFCRWLTFNPNVAYFFGKSYKKFGYVAVLHSLILKLLKYIWLNTSFCRDLNFNQITAILGVNFDLLKSCWCKTLDIYKVCNIGPVWTCFDLLEPILTYLALFGPICIRLDYCTTVWLFSFFLLLLTFYIFNFYIVVSKQFIVLLLRSLM